MPTKTKPKLTTRHDVTPVVFTMDDSAELLDLLGCSQVSDKPKTELIETLQSELKHHRHMLESVLLRPLPAHVRAELKRILPKAQALEEVIDPHRMSTRTWMTLDSVAVDEIWMGVSSLIQAIDAGLSRIESVEEGSTGGARNKSYREAYEAVSAALEIFYERNANLEAGLQKFKEDYKSDFIAICQTYLPTMPNGKHGLKHA